MPWPLVVRRILQKQHSVDNQRPIYAGNVVNLQERSDLGWVHVEFGFSLAHDLSRRTLDLIEYLGYEFV